MKKTKLLQLVILTVFMSGIFQFQLNAQNVNVSGALVGNGTYVDLNSAFAAINSGLQTGASISVSIVGNTTETVTAVLNSGAWNSVSITPSGGTYSVSGNLAAPLVDLNGADNVSINGINSGGNYLVFDNANTGNISTSTIRLINDATLNSISNCRISGASTSANLGTICFSVGIASGNNNNTVANCEIGPSGITFPVNAVFSIGTLGFENSGNTIQNNLIFDFYSTSIATSGVNIAGNNTNWTVTGNRIYQTAPRNYTTANTHKGIVINSGNAHVVNNNIIGYSSSTSTGTYVMSGTIATRFVGIELGVGTLTTSSVNGNTISAITLSTSSGAATTYGILCGINLTGTGSVDVGTLSPNIIGSTSGANIINAYPTTTQGMIVGINSSSSGTVNISNNLIGGLSSSGLTAAVAGGVTGIMVSTSAGQLTIQNNTIGNSTPGNMRAGTLALTTGNSIASGIYLPGTSLGTIKVLGNTIQNFDSFGIGTSGYVRGIWTAAATGNVNTYSITSNYITNLNTTSGLTTISNGQTAATGINLSVGTNGVVSSNTIINVACTGTASTASYAAGITHGNATSSKIFNNKIYNITNAGLSNNNAAPASAVGVIIRSGTTDLTIYNNFISLGHTSTANTAFVGILGNHGSTPDPVDKIYFNTIVIGGAAASGSISSFGIHRGDFSATIRTQSVDIRNNLVHNIRTGGTGNHLAIGNNYGNAGSSTNWGAGASNNNVLNTSSSNIGWWNGAIQTLATWQSTTSCDANSYTGAAVVFSNINNDLHLNMGTTPNLIESGGQNITGIAIDIDNQVRPGPIPSVNGGGIAPDIGADEFDGVILDIMPAVISHTPLGGTCSTSDRTFTVNITDATGVPITGSLVPRVYYKKNANPFVSSAGVLASGTSTNGIWSFTISTAAMSGLTLGDQVSYFVIAQDLVTTPNIGSLPSAGLVATDVNNVTTPPTTPYTYSVAALSGTYTVGSAATFTSLTQAAIVYNNSCLAGPVTYVLVDPVYSTNETFPVVFLNNPTASATNSLLVLPSTALSVSIVPTATNINSVIKFLNAKFITLDGVNSGGSSLTITNSNTTSVSANIWLASSGSGCNTIGVKNLTAIGASTAVTNGLIASVDGPAPSATGGVDNDNITIQGNTILNTYNAILAIGSASVSAGGMDNWTITTNTLGSVSTATNYIGGSGIAIASALNLNINSNLIQNIVTSAASIFGMNINAGITNFAISQNTMTNFVSSSSGSGVTSISGIYIGTNVNTGTVNANMIASITNSNTGGWGARGMSIATSNTLSNIKITNNMISDIRSYSDVGAIYWPIGIALEGLTGGVDIDHNSINLDATYTGLTGATGSAAFYQNSTGGGINLRNNILSNTYNNSTSTTDINYAYYAVSNNATLVASNYNNYYVGGTGNVPTLGYFGTPAASLTALQFATGQDLNSINFAPVFNSSTDLHLVNSSVINAALNNSGLALASVPNDYDLQVRSITTPDIGADEFTSVATCTAASGGTINPALYSYCTTNTVILNSNNMSTGLGTLYNWQVSSVPGGSYTNVAANSGTNLTYYSVLPNGTYYFVLKATCPSNTAVAISNEATVTIGAPTVAISPTNAVVCNNGTLTLVATGAPSYTWSTNANTYSISVTQTASTVYTVTGSSACGVSTATINVAISNPTITAISSNTAVCLGQTATLTASGVNTYTWDSGPTTSVIAVTPTASTNYTVSGTDLNGCTTNTTISVITNTLPVLNVVQSSSAVCAGQSVNLTASGANTYTWNTSATTASISVSPTVSTTYTVTGTNTLGCSNTTTQAVSVNPAPNVTAISSASVLCIGTTATLTASGAVSYTWNTLSTSSVILVSPPATTAFIVTGTDANGCSKSFTITQTVANCTGLSEVTNGVVLSVYPNPTHGMLSIESPVDAEFTVTSLIGQTIKKGKLVTGKNNIDLNEFANGLYLINVKIGDHNNYIRIIKE